jgi:hypothetical protein
LLASAAEEGVRGGAVHDAVVGLIAREHGATLLMLDRCPTRRYDALGFDYRLVT